jgi:integrase/recombinase XerD
MDLAHAVEQHLTSMHDAFSARSTIEGRRYLLRPFVAWCRTQDIHTCAGLTTDAIRRHQHHLADLGDRPARGLSLHARRNRLAALKAFAEWALKRALIPSDPTADLALPHLPRRLPQGVLSRAEADRVLRRPDLATPLGLRDRAILELLYCSGLRRNELDLTPDLGHRSIGVGR